MAAVIFVRLLGLVGMLVLLAPPSVPSAAPATPPGRGKSPKAPADAAPVTSEAERVARAMDAVRRGQQTLETLQKRLDDPNGEYPKAEGEFQDLDRKVTELKLEIARAKKEGDANLAKLEAALPPLQEEWQSARDRFDIAIRQRKLTQEALTGLKLRIAKDQEMLDRLEGKVPAGEAPAPAKVEVAPVPAPVGVAPAKAADGPSPALAAAVPALAAVPAGPAPAPTQTPAQTTAATVGPVPGNPNDPVERRARDLVAAKRAELKEAEARSKTAEDQVAAMEKSMKTVARMILVERESAAQAEKTVAKLTETLATNPPADLAEQQILADRLADARDRVAESGTRAKRLADRMVINEETLKELKADYAAAVKQAEAAAEAVAAAENQLEDLLHPLAARNVGRWLARHGPNLILIAIGMLALHLVTRQFSRQIVQLVARENHRGSADDRENRANTLVGVFRYVAGLAIFGGGAVMLLDEAGVPVVPLMGGAAVIGLAVAFGAQNLIRDYFTGFMMLLEDQYSVNDVVRIGSVSGLVEQITLRVTVLRDLEGIRHVIPHGTVVNVSNLTHGWSRALFDVAVGYEEDVDRAISVLIELARDLRRDPALGGFIIDDPEMLGVEALGDSGVVIRFVVKTRPLKQWPIKRELNRRIKNRFDQVGIKIPFPHRTVYHKFPDGQPHSADEAFTAAVGGS